jgi:Ser/Thr protein kinase RdoA (MazF antagonist)
MARPSTSCRADGAPRVSGFPPRLAELVLVDEQGGVLGALAPIEVASPWWNDIGPLLDALQARDGLRPTVLRLLSAARENQPGGAVRYLAEVAAPVPAHLLRPWAGALPDHPLRQAYARPGGPAADLAWAGAVLHALGMAAVGPPQQIRTWNLSSLWRLPTAGGGEAWLKVVPPFFAHEGQVLALLAGHPVPRLLGRDGARMLLAPIDGEDLYEADLSCCRAMVDLLVDLQSSWQGRGDELAALGLPDWRGPAYTRAAASLLRRRGAELQAAHRDSLEVFVQGLPQRWAAIAECGMTEGLVHGDCHRGNFRGTPRQLTLLDWGDSGVGHPLLDQPALLSRIPAPWVEPLRQHWVLAWRRHQPRADVVRAAGLLAPIASLRQALIYQHFLDHIEDAEHPYHRADVPDWLERTAALLSSGATG